MSRPTLKDVAERVGVSAKTVSNVVWTVDRRGVDGVVNGTGWVADDLKARVREALVEVGYRPNAAARHLRNGKSGMIALAVPELSQPYFAELASAIVRAASERSITVMVNQTDGDPENERIITEGIDAPAMDGLILSPLALSAADLEGRRDKTPLVLLGEHIGSSPFAHVAVDNTAAARAATEHLIAQGCRRIAAIGAQSSGPNETSTLRLEGYRAALYDAGLAHDAALILNVDQYHRADGADAARSLVDRGIAFDGIFALGAMHALAVSGVRIPDDVCVIGFDDIEEGRYSTPALSSVSPDVDDLARRAISILTDAPDTVGTQTIAHAIAHRASTKGASE